MNISLQGKNLPKSEPGERSEERETARHKKTSVLAPPTPKGVPKTRVDRKLWEEKALTKEKREI